MPLFYEVYGVKPHLLDIISLASNPQVRKWLLEDASSKGFTEDNSSRLFDYLIQFGKDAIKEEQVWKSKGAVGLRSQ